MCRRRKWEDLVAVWLSWRLGFWIMNGYSDEQYMVTFRILKLFSVFGVHHEDLMRLCFSLSGLLLS
jgi:hypothetical protein